MLDKIGTEINNFAKMFPVEASLANFTTFLSEGQQNIESYYPQIDQFDFYRFVLFRLITNSCYGGKNLAPTRFTTYYYCTISFKVANINIFKITVYKIKNVRNNKSKNNCRLNLKTELTDI